MKHFLSCLLIASLFFSCQDNNDTVCVEITVMLNGNDIGFNPMDIIGECSIGSVNTSNGEVTNFTLAINSFCDNMSHDYMIVYSVTQGIYMTDNNCDNGGVTNYIYSSANYDITELDEVNSTVTGTIAFPGSESNPSIEIIFTDSPVNIY